MTNGSNTTLDRIRQQLADKKRRDEAIEAIMRESLKIETVPDSMPWTPIVRCREFKAWDIREALLAAYECGADEATAILTRLHAERQAAAERAARIAALIAQQEAIDEEAIDEEA